MHSKYHVRWEMSRDAHAHATLVEGYTVFADSPDEAARTVAVTLNRQGDYYVTKLPYASEDRVVCETTRVCITLQVLKPYQAATCDRDDMPMHAR